MSTQPTMQDTVLTGRVIRKSRGYYFVQVGDRELLCRISNRLRKQLVFPTAAPSSTRQGVVEVRDVDVIDPVAVGDEVRLVDAGGGTGAIREVLPRSNKFSRMARRGRTREQIIAANVDQVAGVFALHRPELRFDLLDRMTIEAEILQVPLLIILTKIDLAEPGEIDELRELYGGLGYRILTTSAVTGHGIDAVREALRGHFTPLIGESGVGKTTLLNLMQPGLLRRTGEVRDDRRGRGRHTTTMVEAVPLDVSGWVVDTPGINDLGLYLPPDLAGRDPASFFPEMRPLLGQCHFGSTCTHCTEPDCAIIEAVENGRIDPGRYESYRMAREELVSGISGRNP